MVGTKAAPQAARVIVLDTAALVAGSDSLYALGGLRDARGDAIAAPAPGELATFFTTPDVVQEVRDPRARARLQILDGAVVLRVPSAEALAMVVKFAKASGDFASLSTADLRVMALAWMLEVEKNGMRFLREEPEKVEFSAFRGVPAVQLEELEERERMEAEAELAAKGSDDEWVTVDRKKPPKPVKKKKKKKKGKRNLDIDTSAGLEPGAGLGSATGEASGAVQPGDGGGEPAPVAAPAATSSFFNEGISAEGDDGIGWINEDNLLETLARDGGEKEATDDDKQRVGCVTTDFAMQNVLLQMGVKLISVDGRRTIRQIRRYALRCHTCTAVTRDLERQFCEKCGNATMHRVAFKVDKNGLARVFVNPKRSARLRGTKYSIPMPRGGRNNTDLILCEDQIDPVKLRRLEKQRARLNVDVLDPSSFYNAGARFNPNDRTVVVGYGRRNPNESRPGSSRGKHRK